MSRSEQGKALAVAGLSFFCAAICELAVKHSYWWVAMITLAVGLLFVLVGLFYARRAGDRERQEEIAQRKRERQEERDADRLERQNEREAERREKIAEVERLRREQLGEDAYQHEQHFKLLKTQWQKGLDELVQCPASDCKDPWQKRRDFYRPLDSGKIRLEMECQICFHKHFGVFASAHPELRVWPEDLRCVDCSEPASREGIDGQPVCITHVPIHSPVKNVIQ